MIVGSVDPPCVGLKLVDATADQLFAFRLSPLILPAGVERFDLHDVEQVVVDGIVGHPFVGFRNADNHQRARDEGHLRMLDVYGLPAAYMQSNGLERSPIQELAQFLRTHVSPLHASYGDPAPEATPGSIALPPLGRDRRPTTAFQKFPDYLSRRLQPARTTIALRRSEGEQHWQKIATSRGLKPAARVRIIVALLMKYDTRTVHFEFACFALCRSRKKYCKIY